MEILSDERRQTCFFGHDKFYTVDEKSIGTLSLFLFQILLYFHENKWHIDKICF